MDKTFFYVIKDGKIEARTATKESAIDLIRGYQVKETHPTLKAEFSIIEGTIEEAIPYPSATSKRFPSRQMMESDIIELADAWEFNNLSEVKEVIEQMISDGKEIR